jgi:hypothetical protein
MRAFASDYPDEKLRTIRWLGDGPYRVWQNRLRAPRWTRMKLRGEHWEYSESWTAPAVLKKQTPVRHSGNGQPPKWITSKGRGEFPNGVETL